MASSDITKPDNPLLMDVTNLNALLKAMRKLDFSEWTDLENGTWQLDYDDQTNTVIIQVLKNGVWTKAGTLDINATSIDGFSATQAVQANTIPVRNAQGVIPGNITGNANSANTAQALSVVNPIAMGGTGANSLDGARFNLGISQLDADVEALDIATFKKTGGTVDGLLQVNVFTTPTVSYNMPLIAYGGAGVNQIGIGFYLEGVYGAYLTMLANGLLSWRNDNGAYIPASFGNLGIVSGDSNQGGRLDFLNEDYTAGLGFIDYYSGGFRFFNHSGGNSMFFDNVGTLSVNKIKTNSPSSKFGEACVNLDGNNSAIAVHVPNVYYGILAFDSGGMFCAEVDENGIWKGWNMSFRAGDITANGNLYGQNAQLSGSLSVPSITADEYYLSDGSSLVRMPDYENAQSSSIPANQWITCPNDSFIILENTSTRFYGQVVIKRSTTPYEIDIASFNAGNQERTSTQALSFMCKAGTQYKYKSPETDIINRIIIPV